MSFKETGRLGCPECYHELRPLIDGIIESSQKGNTHTGKHPHKSDASSETAASSTSSRDIPFEQRTSTTSAELLSLQSQLSEAVKAEEYERAAVLRDKINSLKSQQAPEA